MLVDTENFPETFALGARSDGIVEVEHRVGRLLELETVRLELLGELLQDSLFRQIDAEPADLVAFVERSFD